MKTSEIRQAFIDFFESKDHQSIKSSPLVPANDPTLLFTNAGMVQFKDIFLGKDDQGYSKAVSVQRCLRAGGKHNDLENVGYTSRHHTFFEMLGNFSFGDYFKEDAILFAWDFITNELGLDRDRLWITIYQDDDEAAAIWLDKIGIGEDRLIRLGEKSNFWSMGETGPCGPCSEIFFDHGAHIDGGPPGTDEEDGDRFVEIWNLVFMQYERQANGVLIDLPKPSVDTGMGLERIAAVMQGVSSNYDIDLFQKLINAIKNQSEGGEESHYRVIADHIRSSAFLIMDGVTPDNEGRGYVLRRIIRRALRHGYDLKIESPFFYELVDALADEMGSTYPDLNEKKDYIKRIILMEEERFASTLAQGMNLLQKEFDRSNDETISGEFAFKLYDTYGFPLDMTVDIARSISREVDREGFEKAMDKQREMARRASKFQSDESLTLDHDLRSQFDGYANLETESKIIGVFGKDGSSELKEGEFGQVILDKTPFYAESGGQVGDQGSFNSNESAFEVMDTQFSGDAFAHFGTVSSGQLRVGDKILASVNPVRRKSITLNHTGTHMLHKALMMILGDHVQQRGSLVDDEKIRFDFSHHQSLSASEIREIESIVNEKIEENIDVQTSIMKHDDAIHSGAMALFGEKYGDDVRVLDVGDFSKELCGGTHVANTSEISIFKVISESSISSGTRRIEAITGDKALKWAKETEYLIESLTDLLQTRREDVTTKVESLLDANQKLQSEIKQLKSKIASGQSSEDESSTESISGINYLYKELDNDIESSVMRGAIDQYKNKLKSGVIVLSSTNQKGKVTFTIGVTDDLTSRI
ncbi:MAG: alanine--tRNA ligase, partial [Gammaproteobacteria bacterium]|nr:alanine--tRNA ligase [Gammaproteobacteria bacterium]